MMREDPGLDTGRIAACLEARYGLRVASVGFLPLGYDLRAAAYKVLTVDGTAYFLKVRSGPLNESALLVPSVLTGCGVPNILAPLPTRTAELWCSLEGHAGQTVVLYPFVRGENAMVAGLTDDQWRAFGTTLRAVHASGLAKRFRDQLRVEDFALPSAALVRQVFAMVERISTVSPAAMRFASFWKTNAGRISQMLARAGELGRSLRGKPFQMVLCHADVHAANILASDDGSIWLVDWDGPIIAPPERDLLFVVGSRIARTVQPREEELFFDGYGPAVIDPVALAYYRYERIIEDLGEIGTSVFSNPGTSEAARAEEVELAMRFFVPGGDIERAEVVPRVRWPA